MSDFVTALGLVLVIEGVLWAAFPGFARKMAQQSAEQPEPLVRMAGAFAMGFGVIVIWLVRG